MWAGLLLCPRLGPSRMDKTEKGPSDFNDLHLEQGLQEVKRQIDAALAAGVPGYSLPDIDAPGNVSPVPSQLSRPSVDDCVKRYAWAMPDGKVWDALAHKLLKVGAFKSYLGAKAYDAWLEHEKRRVVQVDDVMPLVAAAQAKGRGGLSSALGRYVYLNPSDSAWDRVGRKAVAMNHLRYAIADCFDQWVKHPERTEIPLENLVFDPTQSVDTETHINKFRGLPLTPPAHEDLDAFVCMRRMLYQLCNEDDSVFLWLLRWLAYPLQHVGAKMATAVLMHSDVHGSGKSYFFSGVMGAIYGEYNKTYGQAQLESQYNDWISETLFGVFEEVLSRSQRYSHTGTIKQMITGSKFYVEKKFLSGWVEGNYMNCVFLSNEVQPLPVEPSDRRFLVIWPESKLLDELQVGVDLEIANGGAEAFYRWLLHLDMGNFTPHTQPPITDAKQRLIDFGLSSWELFHRDWKAGDLDVPYCSCLVRDLFRAFKRWCSQGDEHRVGLSKFSGFLASKERRVRDVHYDKGSFKGKGVFFIIGNAPPGMNQQEWLGGCVQEFDRINSRHDREAA